MDNSVWAVLVTLITVLGSGSVLRYLENRKRIKDKKENEINNEYEKRIIKLEALIQKSSEEKDKMRTQIIALTSEVARLSVKVEFLVKENNALLAKIPKIKTHKLVKNNNNEKSNINRNTD